MAKKFNPSELITHNLKFEGHGYTYKIDGKAYVCENKWNINYTAEISNEAFEIINTIIQSLSGKTDNKFHGIYSVETGQE